MGYPKYTDTSYHTYPKFHMSIRLPEDVSGSADCMTIREDTDQTAPTKL